MKNYLKGFIKGIGVWVVYLIPFAILLFVEPNGGKMTDVLSLLVIPVGVVLAFWLIYKFKMEKYWYIFGIFLGVLIIPFLMGIIEMESKSS